MDTDLIIRAWKDPEFRARLSTEQRASLPDSPSGKPMTELDEGELSDIIGGLKPVEIGGSTGCTGPVRKTCGIVICPIKELEY
ncbi:MAG: mersacidin/lichenicidin family type 2 lantibiotic [Myxococcaceae bacterium]|nr:mersacidin/lichenicidin family type 2 lantibiotic [Myxococcaceae bacterium]